MKFFQCIECFEEEEHLTDTNDPDVFDCPACGGTMTLVERIMAPRVMEQSYPDGTNRWPLMKERSKLRCQRADANANADPAEAKRIDKEIATIESGKYKRIKK